MTFLDHDNQCYHELTDKIVPDTSIVINGRLSKLLESGELAECEIIIPLAVIDELQAQASKGRDVGFKGLEEVKKIREIAEKHGITVRFSGERPSIEDIKLAKSGRIDALIRDVAKSEGGTLYTSDYVQALVAEAEGIPVKYVEPYEKVERFFFEKFLAPDIYSLHLKAGSPPYGKQLKNGDLHVIKLREEPCTEEELNAIIEEVMAASRIGDEYDMVLLRTGAIIIDSEDYRISVAKPPFSDSLEVTIQRNPLKQIIDEKSLEEILQKASDPPHTILLVDCDGIYTTPLAKLLAERLRERGKIVKLIGYSRRAPSTAASTYYGPLDGDLDKALEFLLLTRPDYVIFDEIRRSRDLKLIRELREAGIGVMAFIGAGDLPTALRKAIEYLGLTALPGIVDIFACIKGGKLEVYQVISEIRVPTGLSPANPPKPLVALLKDNRIEVEAFEIDGQLIIESIDTIARRLNVLKNSVSKIMRRIRKIDRRARLKSIALDRVIVKVSASKLSKLLELAPILTAELGSSLEFVT